MAPGFQNRGRNTYLADQLWESDSHDNRRSRSRARSPRLFDLSSSDYGLSGVRRLQRPPANNSADSVPKKLTKFLTKIITDISQAFRGTLEMLAQANSALLKLNVQNDHFVEGRDGYPQGMREFRTSDGVSELDHPWSLASSGTYQLTLNFPAGVSRRQAGVLLHKFFCKHWKAIETEAMAERVEGLSKLAHPDVLLRDVLDAVENQRTTDLAQDLGVLKPHEECSRDDIEAMVWNKYRGLYADFERTLKRRAMQATQQKSKLQAIDEEIKAASPATLFEEAVAYSTRKALIQHGVVLADDVDENMGEVPTVSQSFVNAISSKNEVSPVMKAGQKSTFINPTPKTKPKANPKPKASRKQGNKGSWPSGPKPGKRVPRGAPNTS